MLARYNLRGCLFVVILFVLSGCASVYTCQVRYPGYWPDRNDPNGILVDTAYMVEATDGEGRRWLWPANCKNALYRTDSSGKSLSAFEFNRKVAAMTGGLGSIWAIGLPENPWNTDKYVLKIDLETAAVASELVLPVKLGPSQIAAGRDYIWVYGRLNESFADFTYQLAVLQIDPNGLSTINTYVVPDIIATDDGQKLDPISEPKLVMINEAGYLVILVPTKEFLRGNFTYVQLDLREDTYSILEKPVRPAEVCPEKSQVILTDYGKTAQSSGLGLEDCM